jgi:hypothetical protein
MSNDDINDFTNLYLDNSLSIKERTKNFEILEEEFYNYFINLNEIEMIDFME